MLIRNNIKQGHIKLLNTGIDISKGKFIARMDSDDICLPTRFEDQLEIFNKNPMPIFDPMISMFPKYNQNSQLYP